MCAGHGVSLVAPEGTLLRAIELNLPFEGGEKKKANEREPCYAEKAARWLVGSPERICLADSYW